MVRRVSGLALRLRALSLAAPVMLAWQPGCLMSSSSCGDFKSQRRELRVPLDADAGAGDAGPTSSPEACREFCEQRAFGSNVACRTEAADGGIVVVCSFDTLCEGRRPEGFQPPDPDLRAPLLAQYFAAMAATEAASVVAFERMAAELTQHGLPADLIERARAAAADEARHHRMTAGLARKFGARPQRAVVADQQPRDLLALAIENAREGVVRETFGAAVGWWQADHAREPAVKHVMRRIAEDEALHAELSFHVHAEARERLTSAQRCKLDAAVHGSVAALRRQLDAEVAHDLVEGAGLPSRAVGRALFEAAQSELWS